MEITLMQLKLSAITLDPRAQPRVQIDQDTVDDYADALRAGANFPAVIVFREIVDVCEEGMPGTHYKTLYWLASGWHRVRAHESIGRKAIEADVRDGGLREAILFSLAANNKHGLRLKREDKRRAITTLLTDENVSRNEETGKPWSVSEVSRQCGVSVHLVRMVKKELSLPKTRIIAAVRGGTVYEMDTEAIGSISGTLAEAVAETDEEDLEAGEAESIALDLAEKRYAVLTHSVKVLRNEKEEVEQHAADAVDYLRALELAVIEGEELIT